MVVTAAKLILGPKLTDDKKKTLVFLALDLLQKHRLVLFSLGDAKPALDDVEALIRQAKPDIPDEQIAATRSQIEAAIDQLKQKRAAGTLNELDLVALVAAFGTKLPPEIIGSLSGNEFDLSQLLSTFGAAASAPAAP
jgi:hypothetical protein